MAAGDPDEMNAMVRQQADQARQMADQAREKADGIRKQARIAVGTGFGGSLRMEEDSGRRIMIPGTGSSLSMVLPSFEMQRKTMLIIPSRPIDKEAMGQLTEDMQIMAQILYEKIHPDQAQTYNKYLRWGHDFLGGFFGEATPNATAGLYLEGYGMVFLQQADFPLTAPAEERPAAAPQEGTDETWQRTRQKLQGEYVEESDKDEIPAYDASKVEALKETIVQLLIHASNIRNLDKNSWIIVVVKSGSCRLGFQQMAQNYVKEGKVMMKFEDEQAVPNQMSFLVVRAQKKDIDDFAAGRIEQKTFVEKAAEITY